MFARLEACLKYKTPFETLITRNDVNGVSLCNLFCLITLMAYLCSQLQPNVQIKYLCLIDPSTEYLSLIRAGNVILSK
jgi:hypothetical protein